MKKKIVKIKKAVKKAVKKTKTIHVIALVDETGSMQSTKSETILALNAWFKKIHADSVKHKTPGTFTVTKFNSFKTETLVFEKPLTDADVLTPENYQPQHMTPLYDAIGNEIKATKSDADRVLFTIITDGEENYSKKFTREQVFNLIDKKKKKGWQFEFLGANQDSYLTGTVALGTQVAYDYKPHELGKGMTTCYTLTSGAYLFSEPK